MAGNINWPVKYYYWSSTRRSIGSHYIGYLNASNVYDFCGKYSLNYVTCVR